MIGSNFLKYFSIIALLILNVSCSKDDNKSKKTETVYDLNVKPKVALADSKMSELKKDVFKKLINKQPIKDEDITRLLIEEQVSYYNTDKRTSINVNSVTNWINDVSSINNQSSNVEDIKVLYQEQKLNMNEMKYNKNATSLPYIQNDKRLQCYSSTLLHQLVLRNHSNFKNMNLVAIYEWGHILSGYMKQENGSWKLIGIENTVTGKGIKKYNDLTNYNGKWIRVVDSKLFAILEIFKNDISNPNEVAKQMLDLTAKQYSLDPNFNYKYNDILNQNQVSSYTSNESPLAFGVSKVKDGDKKISEMDDIQIDNRNDQDFDYVYDKSNNNMYYVKSDVYVTSIVGSTAAFAALKSNGSVVTWGNTVAGGDFTYGGGYISPAPESLSSKVYSISSTCGAFAALKENGSVVTWGNIDRGGDAYQSDDKSLYSGIVRIYSSRFARNFVALKGFSSAITEGWIIPSAADYEQLKLSSGVTNIFSNYGAFAAIKQDGSVVTWGDKLSGGDFNYSEDSEYYNYKIAAAPEGSLSSGIVSIYSTDSAFAAIKEDKDTGVRSVVTWGSKYHGGDFNYSEDNEYHKIAAAPEGSLASGVISITATGSSSGDELPYLTIYLGSYESAFAAIKEDENGVRSVVTWGGKRYGGDFNYSDKSTAAAPKGSLSSGIVSISSTAKAFAAIKEDKITGARSVVTWGNKKSGGDFNYSDEDVAAAPKGSLSSGIVSIYSTDSAFAAIKEDKNTGVRSVVTWGDKKAGGDFNYSDAYVAAAPKGSLYSGIVSISSTAKAFAAIKEDENEVRSSVVTWGDKRYGGDFNYSEKSGDLKIVAAATGGTL